MISDGEVVAAVAVDEPAVVRLAGTGATRRSERLDSVRGVAAAMVLCAHAGLLAGVTRTSADGSLTASFLGSLSASIHLFFALSGYLIAGPFLRALATGRPLPDTAGYFIRRAARILPPYWVALAAIVILASPPAATVWGVFVHSLLLQSEVPQQAKTIYFVAWTLGIEAAFYVLVPLAAMLVQRRHRGRAISVDRLALGVVGVWLGSSLWSALAFAIPDDGNHRYSLLHIGLPSFAGEFCPGMLLALALHGTSSGDAGRLVRLYQGLVARPAASLAAVVGLVITAHILEGLSGATAAADARRIAYSLAAGLLLVLVVNAPRWADRVATVLAPLGTVSYGVYLWHFVIVAAMLHDHIQPFPGSGVGPALVDVAALAALTFPIAALSWVLVERPAIRWAAAVSSRRRSPRSSELRD